MQVEKSKKENEELRAAVAKLTADLAALNLQNDSNDKVVAEKARFSYDMQILV